jgi:hypothetical protein
LSCLRLGNPFFYSYELRGLVARENTGQRIRTIEYCYWTVVPNRSLLLRLAADCGLNDKARNENTGKEHYYAHCRCAEKVRTGCDGFFNARRAATCTSKSIPADSRACAGDSGVGCDHRICPFDKFNVRLEQLPSTECGVTTTSGAVNFSTTARKRNQVDKGTLRITFSDTPAIEHQQSKPATSLEKHVGHLKRLLERFHARPTASNPQQTLEVHARGKS